MSGAPAKTTRQTHLDHAWLNEIFLANAHACYFYFKSVALSGALDDNANGRSSFHRWCAPVVLTLWFHHLSSGSFFVFSRSSSLRRWLHKGIECRQKRMKCWVFVHDQRHHMWNWTQMRTIYIWYFPSYSKSFTVRRLFSTTVFFGRVLSGILAYVHRLRCFHLTLLFAWVFVR